MRKTTFKETIKKPVGIEAPKTPLTLDDTTIREIVRGTCRELDDDVSGLLLADNIRVWIVQTVEIPPNPIWVTPEFLKEKTDLLSLWGIYAQRHVLLFDQESRSTEDWNERPLW